MFPDAGSDVVAADDSTPGMLAICGINAEKIGESSCLIGWRQTSPEGQSARWINSDIGRLKFQTPKHQSGAHQ
jgi:hypothetical protein